MKTVTEQQKQDFREQQKHFTLTFSGGAILTNDNIVLDSMRITRTLCDTEQISFSTVYASEFSIQIFNDGRKYEGQTVTVSLTAGTYTANLGTYTVVSNPRSSDRLYRSLTAYDSIAAVLSKNYADWHNGLKNSPPATIGAYRTAFFNHIGITQESTTLCNDATAFNYAETSGALSGATILGELCSINGTFGYLDFDQTFRWVTPYIDTSTVLYPSLTLYPSTTLYPMDLETAIENSGVDFCNIGTDSYDLGGLACEEFVTHNITQVYMHQGDVVYASGTNGNRLTITNTLFIMEPTVAVQAVANIKATVKDFNYTPTSVTMLATPWLELCDVVVAEVSASEKVYFPVLNFVISGTGAIRQTIEAKGVRVNSDEATNTDYKIITASNSADYAAELARQAQQAANTAQEAADTAQQTADDAQTAADTAQQTADDAQTAADTAQDTADTAQETAEEAKATYGTCSTIGSITGKVVVCENFKLEEGAVIEVLFAHGNTSSAPTLNINNTGAVPVYVNGVTPSTLTNPAEWVDNTYINFVYDGTAFNIIDAPSAYTSYCSTANGTAQKSIVDLDNAIIMNGAVLNVTFENGEDSALALALAITGATSRGCMFEDTAVGSANPFTWNSGSKITFTLTDGLWVITDSGATRKAIEAGKTATNYLHFSNNKGLVVSQSPVETDAQIDALTTPNSRVVSDGFDVYKNGTTRVAHFGATTDIGEAGKSHLEIGSTSLKFKNANDTESLAIENDLEGTSSAEDYLVYVDPDNKSYRNQDGSLNTTTLASLISGMVEAHTMTSTAGDYVPSTTGVEFIVEIEGFVEVDSVTGAPSPAYTTEVVWGGQKSISNGVLTLTPTESVSSDWEETVDEWADNFAAGSTGYTVWLNFKLIYPVLGAAMTVGSRKVNTDIGMGSFSVGRNNEASGTGSVTLGKDLTMTDDYGVAIGEGNVMGQYGGAPVALDVGAGGRTAFAVLKTGNIIMSSVNSGRYNDVRVTAGTKSELTVTFEHPYPSVPFVFLTLCEDNIPDNRVTDYSAIQIYLKSVSTDQFSVFLLNGSSRDHTFGFNWFAICAM